MSKLKITGNTTPIVGVKEFYSVIKIQDDVFPDSKPNTPNAFDQEIKWFIYILDRGKWRLAKGNEKTGAKVDFKFTQVSLRRKEIKMIVHAYGEKAMIDIKPQKASEGKILHVDLLDANYNIPTRPFAYRDYIIARVHCVDMELLDVKVTLWEDDGDKYKQKNNNIKIDTKQEMVINGMAYVSFYLDPNHAWLANAKLAKGDKDEGEFHEYYVTAEIFEKIPLRTSSKNANVSNPDYKPPVSEPKKPTPAQQKGPSKKEQKGIVTSGNKVHDYHEQKVAVKKTVNTDPFFESLNSYLKVGMKPWNFQDKTKCYCNKDFEEKDVRKLVKLLKGSETIWEGVALKGGKRLQCNIRDKSFTALTRTLNISFKKHNINTCAQKMHFLAQVCEETGTFAMSEEIKGDFISSQSVYKGRGLLQLTGVKVDPEDKNSRYDKPGSYKDYADYKNDQNIVKKPEVISNNIDYCIDSGAWIWSVNKKMTKDLNSIAIKRWGKETVGKSLNELAVFEDKYLELISVLLNGRNVKNGNMPNGWEKRKSNYNLLKAFFFKYNVFHNNNSRQFNAKDVITYHIYQNGEIERHIPKKIKTGFEKKYKYVYHDKNQKEHEICIVDFRHVQNWIKGTKENRDGQKGWEKRVVENKTRYYQKGLGQVELVKIILPINYKSDDVLIKIGDNTNREYLNPLSFASMLGAVAECGYTDFNFNGSTSEDGTGAPSVSHVNGVSFDFRYLRKDKTGSNLYINEKPQDLDVYRQEKFIDALCNFGYSKFYSVEIVLNGKKIILKKSTNYADHHHHLHVRRDNYNPKFKEIKE